MNGHLSDPDTRPTHACARPHAFDQARTELFSLVNAAISSVRPSEPGRQAYPIGGHPFQLVAPYDPVSGHLPVALAASHAGQRLSVLVHLDSPVGHLRAPKGRRVWRVGQNRIAQRLSPRAGSTQAIADSRQSFVPHSERLALLGQFIEGLAALHIGPLLVRDHVLVADTTMRAVLVERDLSALKPPDESDSPLRLVLA